MRERMNDTKNEWQVVVNPEVGEIQELRRQLANFNTSHAEMNGVGLGIFKRDSENTLKAGIYGWLWGACLEIDYLWVDGGLRGQGIGRRLLQNLEKEAISRSARVAVLDTFDWQASLFYQKYGYEIFGTIEGYGKDHKKYFMRRDLTQ